MKPNCRHYLLVTHRVQILYGWTTNSVGFEFSCWWWKNSYGTWDWKLTRKSFNIDIKFLLMWFNIRIYKYL